MYFEVLPEVVGYGNRANSGELHLLPTRSGNITTDFVTLCEVDSMQR
jgi:hypothetical protein